MAISKILPDVYVPTFEMVVDGKKLEPAIAKTILEVSVTEVLNQSSSFHFRLNDPTLKFINKEDGRFTEGKRVEISLGYVGKTQKMIVGKISGLTADFPSSGPATLEIQGFDILHHLTRGTIYRNFEGSKPESGLPDSKIVSQIASEMSLKSSVDQTLERTVPRVQDHISNFAVLEELARANGYFLWVDRNTLYFKQARAASTPDPIPLERGKTLMSFSPRLSTAGQVKTVEVRGWDPMKNQPFFVRVERSNAASDALAKTGLQQIAQGTGGRSEIVITNAPVFNAKEAEAYAKAMLSDQQQASITGSGTSVGNPNIRAGTLLKLSGIGRFKGTYMVTEVTHTVSDSGYQTSFQVNGASHAFDLSSPSDSRAPGRISGVVVGIVIGNKDIGIGRVKVKFPGMSGNEIGHMARLAVPMAGAERGTFFLPEVNDEVLVAFEHGDITRPYVIGALWNGKHKPPATNADGKNNLRFIKSRSGHIVRLDDTDGAEKVEVIDKTGNNRITIDAANNTITIKSTQDVHIEASQGTIKLSAKTIELASSAETKIQAKGGATLDGSPGNTTLKGTTVNLN